jgi:hypothetical protein
MPPEVVRSHRGRPLAGDVVFVGRSASVQFSGKSAFYFRIIRVDDRPTYHGWCWLQGYVINGSGTALERRSIFVQAAGLRPAALRNSPATPCAPAPNCQNNDRDLRR